MVWVTDLVVVTDFTIGIVIFGISAWFWIMTNANKAITTNATARSAFVALKHKKLQNQEINFSLTRPWRGCGGRRFFGGRALPKLDGFFA